MKKVETGGMKVGEVVKKIWMNDLRVRKVWRSVRFGPKEYVKLEQDAMLPGAGEEEIIKCFDDITRRSCLGRREASTRKRAEVSS